MQPEVGNSIFGAMTNIATGEQVAKGWLNPTCALFTINYELHFK